MTDNKGVNNKVVWSDISKHDYKTTRWDYQHNLKTAARIMIESISFLEISLNLKSSGESTR